MIGISSEFLLCFVASVIGADPTINELKEEINGLKHLVGQFLVNRDHDLKTIEQLVAQRREDRHKLDALAKVVEENQNQIAKYEEEIRELKVELNENSEDNLKVKNEHENNSRLQGLVKQPMKYSIPGALHKRLAIPDNVPAEMTYPAFTACVSTADDTTLRLGQYHTVIFDEAITNSGGYYHSTTGVFTAPQADVYMFQLSIMVAPGKELYLRISKDGLALDDVYSDARSDPSFDSTTEAWILDLQKGSEVWISASNVGDIHGYCHSHFSGFLLHATEV